MHCKSAPMIVKHTTFSVLRQQGSQFYQGGGGGVLSILNIVLYKYKLLCFIIDLNAIRNPLSSIQVYLFV